MRPRLHVHRVDPTRPATAAASALRPCLDRIPRSRPVIVAVVGHGAGPGLSVAPWTLDAVVSTLIAAGWDTSRLHHVLLGSAEPQVRARLVALGIGPASESPTLALAMAGTGGWIRIPRGWIGASLCLVTPLCQRLGRRGTAIGPVVAGLEALAAECSSGRPSNIGGQIADQAFAGSIGVVDGTWWADLDSESHPRWLVSVERALATHDLSAPGAADAIDHYVATQLGLSQGSGRTQTPVCLGAGRDGWPRVPATGLVVPRGLAGRALDALWRAEDHSRGRARTAALAPPVPGPLGRVWHSYRGATTERS